ncbi:hypothetical protein ACQR2W_00055 [Clostridium perfringens]
MEGTNIKDVVSGIGYKIFIDDLDRIRVEIEDTSNKDIIASKVVKLASIVNKIDNLPLSIDERRRYQKDIINIYQIGLLSDEELAKKYAYELKNDIERNLIIRKKQVLFLPVIIAQIIIIIISIVLYKINFFKEINLPIIFGSVGGILSIIFYNNKLEIDYYVADKLLYFEAFKLVILPNIMSIIGCLAIKSEFILGNKFNSQDNQYLSFLIYIICGYSQTFIPNILKNFEIQNIKER